ISTNPYFEFEAIVPESGEFTFTWYDDDGSVYTDTHSITVGGSHGQTPRRSPAGRFQGGNT
ncbi:thiosulfate oxidation carrier complex protein SoxZ, partial [Escherichia coli]